MKKIIMLLILALSLFGQDDSNLSRLSLTLVGNGDEQASPKFFVPIYWSDHFYSGVGYANGNFQSHESSSNGVVGSEMISVSESEQIVVNVLSYQESLKNKAIYSIGFGATKVSADFDQVGFAYQYADPSNSLTQYSRGTQEGYQFGLYGDFSQTDLWDFFSYRVGGTLYPLTLYSYTQTTTAIPTPTYDKTISEDNRLQSMLQYDLFVIGMVDIQSYVSILVSASVAHSNLSRDYIDFSSDRQDFVTIDYERDMLITTAGVKLLFPSIAYKGVSPSIGLSRIKTAVDDKFSTGSSYSDTESKTVYLIGLEKPF